MEHTLVEERPIRRFWAGAGVYTVLNPDSVDHNESKIILVLEKDGDLIRCIFRSYDGIQEIPGAGPYIRYYPSETPYAFFTTIDTNNDFIHPLYMAKYKDKIGTLLRKDIRLKRYVAYCSTLTQYQWDTLPAQTEVDKFRVFLSNWQAFYNQKYNLGDFARELESICHIWIIL